MCTNSKNSRSSNVFPLKTTSSTLDIDAIRLLSNLGCSSTYVDSNYLEDPITIVSNFRNLRNIKAEIDFTTVKYIAEGGFGKISSARLQNGSEVAIKEIKEEVYTEYYTEDTMLNRIWNEAANFIKVKGNPKFIELLGIYINDINRPCLSMAIVMERADGDLEKYKNAVADNKEVKLSYGNIRYIALEIFSIIEACKQVKIGYVDFHLGNILVFNVAKKLKLCDFDKIKTFVNCRSMLYEASCELLELSYANYGKSNGNPIKELLKIYSLCAKEKFKNKLSDLLGGDDRLCNIIFISIIAYNEKLKKETNLLENIINQLQSCELEPFPALKMV